jgi:hypothetical protein
VDDKQGGSHLKLEELSELAAYDRLVDESPQGILFCHSWWLDAVAPGQYQVLTVERGGAIKAALPIVFRKWAAGLQISMPKLTQKLGILFAPSQAKYAERLSDEHELVGQLIEKLPVGCSFDQQFHENFTNWLPFYWEGFSQSTKYTYIIDNLSDVDAIWGNFRTRARQCVRKAAKEGIRIRETNDIELLYNINRKTFERQGMRMSFNVEFLARIDTAASKNAGRKAFVAEDPAGRPHACVYFLYDERCAIGLLKGADPALCSSGAQTLLEWEAIKFASTVTRSFDFNGSMIRGVENHLRNLGARLMPYSRIWRPSKQDPRAAPRSRFRRFTGWALREVANRIIDPV